MLQDSLEDLPDVLEQKGQHHCEEEMYPQILDPLDLHLHSSFNPHAAFENSLPALTAFWQQAVVLRTTAWTWATLGQAGLVIHNQTGV